MNFLCAGVINFPSMHHTIIISINNGVRKNINNACRGSRLCGVRDDVIQIAMSRIPFLDKSCFGNWYWGDIPFLLEVAAVLATFAHPNHIVWGFTHFQLQVGAPYQFIHE